MKAVTYSAFGAASDVLAIQTVDTPSPAPGDVLVRLVTSGVNPSDVKARAGGRPGVTEPPFPVIIPHSDGAGVIEAVGDGVPIDRIGERVWIWNGQWRRAFGTAAEYIALPSEQAVPLPDKVPFDVGAVLGIPGLTATHTVLGGGSIAGKIVLISGGSGTVGRLAIQIAAASGAIVLTTVRDDAAAIDAKAAGADHIFLYGSADLAAEIMAATGGRPVDRIVEVEFGNNIETNTAVIAENGTISAYGSALKMVPELPFYPLMFKAVKIELALIYLLTQDERRRAVDHLSSLLERDVLDFRIHQKFELADCAAAHDLIASGNRAGSILLSI